MKDNQLAFAHYQREPVAFATVRVETYNHVSSRELEWWEILWQMIRFQPWRDCMKVTFADDPRFRIGDIIHVDPPQWKDDPGTKKSPSR